MVRAYMRGICDKSEITEIKRITPTTSLWQDLNFLVKTVPQSSVLNANFFKEPNEYNNDVTEITLGAPDGSLQVATIPLYYLGAEATFSP